MKCQFCGKEIEDEPLHEMELIYAKKHYEPTFFLKFKVCTKGNGGIVKAQLCPQCLKEMYKVLEKELYNE